VSRDNSFVRSSEFIICYDDVAIGFEELLLSVRLCYYTTTVLCEVVNCVYLLPFCYLFVK